jgi:hypothetical protein
MALDGEAEQDWFIQQHWILISYAGIKSEAEFLRVLEGSLHVHSVQYTPLKKTIDKLAMVHRLTKVMITPDL